MKHSSKKLSTFRLLALATPSIFSLAFGSTAFATTLQTALLKNDMVNYPGVTNPSMACLGTTIGTMSDTGITALAPGQTYSISFDPDPAHPTQNQDAQFSIAFNSSDQCSRWGGAGSYGIGLTAKDASGSSWAYYYPVAGQPEPITGVSITTGTDCDIGNATNPVCYDLNYTPQTSSSLILQPNQPTTWVNNLSRSLSGFVMNKCNVKISPELKIVGARFGKVCDNRQRDCLFITPFSERLAA